MPSRKSASLESTQSSHGIISRGRGSTRSSPILEQQEVVDVNSSFSESLDLNCPNEAMIPSDTRMTRSRRTRSVLDTPVSRPEMPTDGVQQILREMRIHNNKMTSEFTRVHIGMSGISDRVARLERQTEEMAKAIAALQAVKAVVPTTSSRPGPAVPFYAPGI